MKRKRADLRRRGTGEFITPFVRIPSLCDPGRSAMGDWYKPRGPMRDLDIDHVLDRSEAGQSAGQAMVVTAATSRAWLATVPHLAAEISLRRAGC